VLLRDVEEAEEIVREEEIGEFEEPEGVEEAIKEFEPTED
jgi:hypothetical protein